MKTLRPSKDAYFINMLNLVAARSTCGRRAVGAIITDFTGHILSTGYNGPPPGFAHCIDFPCAGMGDAPGDTARCEAVHAEQNALLQCHRLDLAHTMYVSCTPCFVCSKLICATPIQLVIAAAPYADERGLRIMEAKRIMLGMWDHESGTAKLLTTT